MMTKVKHDHGFAHDFPNMMGRRRFLALGSAMGAALVAQPLKAADLASIPWETAGPYPGDGSNTADGQIVNVLTQEGVIREDLRVSFAGLEGTADGLELGIEIKLLDYATGAPLGGHALYLWHCDAVGDYSIYNLSDQNYLRGVGISDADGIVRFTSIFPGCYRGRWPHFHFEVFESAEAAVAGSASMLTAQIALPSEDCATVYAGDARYASSISPFNDISIPTDNVFADNGDAALAQQTMALTGELSSGYFGSVTVPIDPSATRSAGGAMPPMPEGGQPPKGDRPS